MKRFQFTIRDLLLIIVIAALAAGWWIDHQRINRLAVQQWDYQSRVFNWSDDDLKPLGDAGWEACGTMDSSDGNTHHPVILFKRAK